MAIVRYNPLRELRGMQEQLREGAWQPLVDIFENEEAVVIRAELAGVEQEAIEVKIEGATLTIRGERKQDAEVRQENYHRIERYYGPFQRSFLLPQTIDQEKVQAACDKGVLTITLPKKELIKPKQITVKVK